MKARSDSVLKSLPADRQMEIYSRLTEQTATWADTSLNAVKKWLAEDGLKTSVRALSEFRRWYAAQQDLQETSDLLETFEEFTRKQNPDWSADKVRDVSIQFFMAHTVATKDVNKFVPLVQLDQNERFGRSKAGFKEREVSLAEAKAADAKKSEQEKALEFCLDEAKGFPEVQDLFKAAFAALKSKLKTGLVTPS